MSERISKKQVAEMFEHFCVSAKAVGFDTSNWRLRIGDAYRSYKIYMIPGESRHPMGETIGRNSREAHTWLTTATGVLRAVANPMIE